MTTRANDNRKIALIDEDSMKKAVLKVVKRGYSIRGVATKSGIPYATLRKYVAKYNSTKKENRKSIRYFPNYEVNQIFSKEMERRLEKYILMARRLHYGLTSDNIKRLSYDLAIKQGLKVPKSWEENKKAGKHWLYGYLRRHPLINEILSWSRKFRPPVKKQFNTTVELAQKKTGDPVSTVDTLDTSLITDIEVSEPFNQDQETVVESQKPVIIIPIKKKVKENLAN